MSAFFTEMWDDTRIDSAGRMANSRGPEWNVVDDKKLVGIVSLLDVASAAAGHKQGAKTYVFGHARAGRHGRSPLTSVLVSASIVATARLAQAQVATPPMTGRWRGEAQIAVNWTKQRTLDVDIRIDRYDNVIGTIGNAKPINGRLLNNRGQVARRLGWKTDYVIDGELEGAIIASEGMVRSSVTLPLNWMSGHFEGGVSTSGSELGAADRMIIAAGHLVLHRVPDVVLCQSLWRARRLTRDRSLMATTR